MLAARGEAVRAVDSGHPEGAAGLEGVGVEVFLDTDGLAQLEGTRTVVKSPGVPREAPVIAAALERGIEVVGEMELAWRALPNRFVARDRDQRQDDHGRAARPPLPHAPASRSRCRQRRHGALRAGRRGRARGDDRLRVLELPARGHASPSPPSARSSSTSPPTTSTATATSSPTWRRSCGSSPTRATTTSPSTTPTTPSLAGTDLGGCARRVAFCRGAGPDCEVAVAEGTIFYDGEPLLPVSELGLFGEHNVANAMAAAAAALSMGIDREAVRDGPAQLRRRPAPARAGRRDRRRPLRQRLEGDQRRLGRGRRSAPSSGGVHAILGGSEKDEPFAPLVEPLARACRACYLIGATAERMARELAPVVEAGVELHRCADLEDAVRRAAAARRAGRGRPALAGLRQLRRLRELRAAGRSLPRDRRGAGDERDERDRRLPRGQAREEREEARPRRSPPSTTCCSPRPSACWRWAR